jgi:DivIVA domain-containing protein
MPIASEDVRNKLFGRQLRGYAMKDVDDFMDGVAAELDRLAEVIRELEARLGDTRRGSRTENGPSPPRAGAC